MPKIKAVIIKIHQSAQRDEHEHEHKYEHEQELEVPIICARKVETTPVPDLNIYDDYYAEKGGKESAPRRGWS